jgi:methylmalonyl-CoA mutase C-terminal domain/subunit
MLGTDVHNKGIRTLAQLLRDAGLEVIYLGEHNTAAGIVNAIMAEDPDIVGLSYSTATYMHYTRDLVSQMRAAGVGDVPLMIGGLIHADDELELRQLGVNGIFGPGSTTTQILQFIERSTGKSLRAIQRDNQDDSTPHNGR